MKIKQLRIQGFGLWTDREFQFADGINLIEAPNESGKSTLIQGMFALLFGRNREGYRKKTKAEWYEHFFPWSVQERYGGSVQYQLGDELYELVRSLIDDDQQLIRCSTGEEITDQFVLDQKKERLYLEQQIGLSGELLKRISFINSLAFAGHQKSTTGRIRNHDQELVQRFTRLLQQGEEFDLQYVLDDLKQQMDTIGALSAATSTPYGRICRQVADYEQQWKKWQQQKEQIANDEKTWQRHKQQTIQLEKELHELERNMRDCEQQQQREERQLELVHQWEKLQLQLATLDRQIDDLAQLKERKAQLEQGLNHPQLMLIEREEIDQFFYLAQKGESLQTQLSELHDEQKQVEEYLQSKQSDAFTQAINEAEDMLDALDEYDKLESMLREYGDRQQEKEDRQADWEHDVTHLREQNRTHWQRRQADYWLSFSIFLTFLSALTGWSYLWVGVVIGTLSIVGFIGFAMIYKNKQQERQVIFARWQVSSWDELLLLQASFEDKLTDEPLRPIDCERRMEQIGQQVHVWLSHYLTSLPPFEPQMWQREVERLQVQFQQQEQLYDRQSVQLSYLRMQADRLQSEREQVATQCKELRQLLGIDDSVEWREWRKQWQQEQQSFLRYYELEKELQMREKAAELAAWAIESDELKAKMEQIIQQLQGSGCRLYQNSSSEVYYRKIRNQYQEKQQLWQEEKNQLAELRGSLDIRAQQLTELGRVEVAWKQAKEEKKRLELERSSYRLAIEVFEQAREQVHRDLAPLIAPVAMRWISKIVGDRYQECQLSPKDGFTLRFRERMSGKYYPVERLSRGTIDQIYFALRLAFVQFYSEQTSPAIHLPLFLDDSFVHFDEERLQKTLQILQQFSRKHQIFLCTCHHRERKLMEAAEIPFHRLELGARVELKTS